jgi:hypothetical protein
MAQPATSQDNGRMEVRHAIPFLQLSLINSHSLNDRQLAIVIIRARMERGDGHYEYALVTCCFQVGKMHVCTTGRNWLSYEYLGTIRHAGRETF